MIKYCLILVMAICVHANRLQSIFESCMEITGVEKEIAFKARSHNLTFDDNHDGKCFLHCICSNAGFCDTDLNLVTKFLEEGTKLDKTKVREVGAKCSGEMGTDECDTVYKRFKCFFSNVPETPVH